MNMSDEKQRTTGSKRLISKNQHRRTTLIYIETTGSFSHGNSWYKVGPQSQQLATWFSSLVQVGFGADMCIYVYIHNEPTSKLLVKVYFQRVYRFPIGWGVSSSGRQLQFFSRKLTKYICLTMKVSDNHFGACSIPMCSMVLEYLPTFTLKIHPVLQVHIPAPWSSWDITIYRMRFMDQDRNWGAPTLELQSSSKDGMTHANHDKDWFLPIWHMSTFHEATYPCIVRSSESLLRRTLWISLE